MTFTTAHMSVSLDGFVAGPDQCAEDPIGRGGLALHQWHFDAAQAGHEVDARWTERLLRRRGAYLMGRNMFGPVRGSWSSYGGDWRGWWGQDPPYHAAVFVLTHHPHEPIQMDGGTSFYSVTEGFATALAMARDAGEGDVDIAGGASVIRQALDDGELDELTLDIVPTLLGDGERIFDATTRAALEPLEAEHSLWTTHVRYRIHH